MTMDLDTMLSNADPARRIEGAWQMPADAERLFQSITGIPPLRPGAGSARGRLERYRRRSIVCAGLAAAAACAAIVVPAIIPGGRSMSVITAAYAVVRHPDGTVTLSVGQVTDARGIRQALAAVGVPAVVRTERLRTRQGRPDRCNGNPHNAACYSPSGRRLPKGALSPGGESVASCSIPGERRFVEPAVVQRAVLVDRSMNPSKLIDGTSWLPGGLPGTLSADFDRGDWRHRYGASVTIVPSAMPSGSAVYLNIGTYDGTRRRPESWEANLEVVRTARLPGCVQSFG
jgi:hypothetical protein